MVTGRLARLVAWCREVPAPPWASPYPVPEDKGQIGVAAQALLDDPVLHLALDRVQEKLVATWLATAPGERQAREAAYRLHWAAEQFRSELRIMIANASVAGRQ
jgi:hypothetical protein